MKKNRTLLSISLLIILCFSFEIIAQEAGDLLDKAKRQYTQGKLSESLKTIEEAKQIIENKLISTNNTEYIEIKNWDIVKLKPDFYLGKKIKFNMKYLDISSDGEKIITSEILIPGSPFDKKLIDKILTLKKYSTYTFFGKVINIEYFGTGLYIESIK